MSSARKKRPPRRMKPFIAYMAVQHDGSVHPDRFALRKNPIRKFHLWDKERCVTVRVSECRPRKKPALKARAALTGEEK